MPRWEVHLCIGAGAALVLSFALFMGAFDEGGLGGISRASGTLLLPMSLGIIALLAGSLLPDLDGKGVIRWFIGPLAGAMVLVPPLASSSMDGGLKDVLDYLAGPGARAFLFSCGAGYLLLLVPFKHRGFLHTQRAGLIYGTAWGAYLLALALFDPLPSLLAGAMGYLGYSWHLALDGRS